MLISALSVGSLTGCGPAPDFSKAQITADSVYTNNFHVPGVGYYHAPFRQWYPLPYNHFDAKTARYYYGGQWSFIPAQSITNISPPLDTAARLAESKRTDVDRNNGVGFVGNSVQRGGFGSSSGSQNTWS